MQRIERAKRFIKQESLDGWLLYDFRKNNELAHSALQIPLSANSTRRFFYWIPKDKEPVKIVHAIESMNLDHLVGEKITYLSWQSLEEAIKRVLQGAKKIAMEYSPNNQNPYISRVDGGTLELIRSFGIEVVSSGSFLAAFSAELSQKQRREQEKTAEELNSIVQKTWGWIAKKVKQNQRITEYDAQRYILEEFKKRSFITDHDPIVAVGPNSADPHYVPLKEKALEIKEKDFLLIDLWAKQSHEDAVFGDLTKVAVLDSHPTKRQEEIFDIVRKSQSEAFSLVEKRFLEKKRLEGWEVDEAARQVIEKAGYGKFFLHRTGHSIEKNLHGSGTHIDNLEVHDERPIMPSSCFSLEPGIYLPDEFGVRLEFDVLIEEDGRPHITGGKQEKIEALFS